MSARLRPLFAIFTLLAALSLAAPAAAQSASSTFSGSSIAVRGGITAGDKQGFGGVQIESAGLAPHLDLTFRPGVDLGFGSGQTLLTGYLPLVFSAKFSDSWTGFFGGGPSVVFLHEDGFNGVHGTVEGLVGFRNARGLFVEVSASRFPNPSLRLAVGITLHRHQ